MTTPSNATVRGCTAWYWRDANDTIPTENQCNSAYSHILANGIGGALGYDRRERRTRDPLYVIYPKNGKGNCFKAPQDSSPPLAMNQHANGKSLSTCPTSSSRRRATKITKSRQSSQENDTFEKTCKLEKTVWRYSCSAVCLATVASALLTGITKALDHSVLLAGLHALRAAKV